LPDQTNLEPAHLLGLRVDALLFAAVDSTASAVLPDVVSKRINGRWWSTSVGGVLVRQKLGELASAVFVAPSLARIVCLLRLLLLSLALLLTFAKLLSASYFFLFLPLGRNPGLLAGFARFGLLLACLATLPVIGGRRRHARIAGRGWRLLRACPENRNREADSRSCSHHASSIPDSAISESTYGQRRGAERLAEARGAKHSRARPQARFGAHRSGGFRWDGTQSALRGAGDGFESNVGLACKDCFRPRRGTVAIAHATLDEAQVATGPERTSKRHMSLGRPETALRASTRPKASSCDGGPMFITARPRRYTGVRRGRIILHSNALHSPIPSLTFLP